MSEKFSPKQSLPHGWIVKTSTKYPDRVYYFNLKTGNSTWELPELDAPRKLDSDAKEPEFSESEYSSEEEEKCNQELANFNFPVVAKPIAQQPNQKDVKNISKLRPSPSDKSSKNNKIVNDSSCSQNHGVDETPKPVNPTVGIVYPVPQYSLSSNSKSSSSSIKTAHQKPKMKDLSSKTDAKVFVNKLVAMKNISDSSAKASCKRPHSNSDLSEKNSITEPSTSVSTPGSDVPTKKIKVSSVQEKVKKKKSNLLKSVTVVTNNEIVKRLSVPATTTKTSSSTSTSLQDNSLPNNNQTPEKGSQFFKIPFSPIVDKSKNSSFSSSNVSLASASSSAIESDDSTSSREMSIDREIDYQFQTKNSSTSIQSDFPSDVEMLDVSAELTTINDLTAQESVANCSYYLVVDTNVLISDLAKLDDIKDTELNNSGLPHIFIPWRVIQELDGLKQNRNNNAGKAAQAAVVYLNKILRAKHPRFHGQSPQEANEWAKSYNENNDDEILECCKKLAEKMPVEKVILITNDKALETKALVSNVVIHTIESLRTALIPYGFSPKKSHMVKKKKKKGKRNQKKSTITNSSSDISGNDSITEIDQSPRKKSGVNEKNDSSKLVLRFNNMDAHTLMSKAKDLLKTTLDAFLVDEMEKAFGHIWKKLVIDRSVLKNILKAINRYWRSVFGLTFSKKDKSNFDFLYEKADRPEGFMGDKQDCVAILTTIDDVFLSIKRKNPSIYVPIAEIQALRISFFDRIKSSGISNEEFQQLVNRKAMVKESDSNCTAVSVTSASDVPPTEAETKSILEAFNYNWCTLNNICGTITEFYNVPYDFPFIKQSFGDDDEHLSLLVHIIPLVNNLKKIMCGVVGNVKTFNPRKTIFGELYETLRQLIPSLNLPGIGANVSLNFDCDALEQFCRAPENRETIENGSKQVAVFLNKLMDTSRAVRNAK